MKLKLLALCLIASITACTGDAEKTVVTDKDYHIDTLFTVDGCTVYRFSDAGSKYFTNCNGSVQYKYSCGKNCVRIEGVD